MLKNNKGIILIVLIAVTVTVIGAASIVLVMNNNSDNSTNANNDLNNSNIENSTVENTENNNNINNTKVTGLKRNTLNDYYNIDTSKFDKSKFNGEINFFGTTVNGKITTNKLKNLGITIDDTVVYSKKSQREHYQETGIWNFGYGKFSINTTANITNSDSPITIDPNSELSIIDYNGGQELYSDSTVVVMHEGILVNLTGRNIFPKQLEVNNYNEITIDLVLEKLGNPTYVDGRTSSYLDNEYSYTTYLYVYDDVAFVFSFYNWKNLALAGIAYHPIETLNGSTKSIWNYNQKEYNSIIEVKEAEQNDYLKSIK